MANPSANEGIRHLIYQSLDATKRQIRVLELYPGASSTPLECRLSITSIPCIAPIVTTVETKTQLLQGELKRQKAKTQQLEGENRLLKAVIQLETLRRSNEREAEALLQNVSEHLPETPDEERIKSRLRNLLLRVCAQGARQRDVLSRIAKQRNALATKSNYIFDKADSPNEPEAVSDSTLDTRITSSSLDETEHNLHDATMKQYEAVSYCWGNSQSKTKIFIESLSFEAPSSAVEVLRHLRYVDETRVLWIDALCIDQENFNERNQQVGMMGDVYTNSTKTLIWLGPSLGDNKTESAFQLCTTISQQITGDSQLHDLSDTDSVASICEKIPIPDIYDPVLLDVVFASEWFTRTWVWQEAALSPISICHIGSFTIPWQDIMLTAFWCIETIDLFEDKPDGNAPDEATLWNMHLPSTIFMTGFTDGSEKLFAGIALSQIVHQSRHSKATNPKDKIYGLLGMTKWSRSGRPLPTEVRPNYSESVRNCILNATRAMIEEDAHLNVLSDSLLHVDRGPGSEYELWPSWTPIWCIPDDLESPIPLGISYHAHDGRGLSIDRLKTCFDPDILTLDGYEIDTVEKTVFIADDCFSDIASTPADFLSLHQAIAHQRHLSAHALLLTLLASRYQDQRVTEDSKIIEEFVDYVVHSSDSWLNARSNESNHGSLHEIDDSVSTPLLKNVRDDMRRTIESRHLFTTKHGRIGIGPRSLREDDNVVVLFGGRWPFILREQEGHYVLIGHAFVRGIMDGEAVKDMNARRVPVRTFDIH